MKRRQALQAFGTTVVFFAGCTTEESNSSTTTQPPGDTPGPSPTKTASNRSPEALLPEEGNGWRLKETDDGFGWSPRGASDGIFGYYTSPDGNNHKVVIMEMDSVDPQSKAEIWKCNVGWNVALPYQQFAIAAGTGTVQQTYTPERPPQMTQTPVPDTVAESEQLLARSPELTEERIEKSKITESEC